MPGSAAEVRNAEEEGVAFEWLAAPKLVLGDAGQAKSLRVARMQLGAPDQSGRRVPEVIEGAEGDLEADLVIKALGFTPEDLPGAFGRPELQVTRHGTLKVDPRSFATPLPGIFAAGDIVRGASLVVWAIHDGQKAAAGIHDYLQRRAKAAQPRTVGKQQERYDPRAYAAVAEATAS
jgi:glutamate synthase (NADPH/NADH) small chain